LADLLKTRTLGKRMLVPKAENGWSVDGFAEPIATHENNNEYYLLRVRNSRTGGFRSALLRDAEAIEPRKPDDVTRVDAAPCSDMGWQDCRSRGRILQRQMS
jgi:hypothetical protein